MSGWPMYRLLGGPYDGKYHATPGGVRMLELAVDGTTEIVQYERRRMPVGADKETLDVFVWVGTRARRFDA